MIEVTEADRKLFSYLLGWDVTDHEQHILQGKFDGHVKMQKIARHRQQAEAAMRELCCTEFEAMIDYGYDIPGSKVEKCEHGQFGWEDCIACYDKTLRAKIAAIRGIDAGGEG